MPYINTYQNLATIGTDLLNEIGEKLSEDFGITVTPVTNARQTLWDYGKVITGLVANKNAFCQELMNQFVIRFQVMDYSNRFSKFKKGVLGYGESVENIFVNIARGFALNTNYTAEQHEDPLEIHLPDVKADFYTINVRTRYPVTIPFDMLDEAFLDYSGVNRLWDLITGSLYKAYEVDEMLLTKLMFAKKALSAIDSGVNVDIDADDTTNGSELLIAARQAVLDFEDPTTEYNEAGVYNNCPIDRVEVVLTNKALATVSVKDLATAFHLEYADFKGNVTNIRNFYFTADEKARLLSITDMEEWPMTAEDEANLARVRGIVCDRELMQIYDAKEPQMWDSNVNSAQAYRNYDLHIKQIFAISSFANAVVITTSAD